MELEDKLSLLQFLSDNVTLLKNGIIVRLSDSHFDYDFTFRTNKEKPKNVTKSDRNCTNKLRERDFVFHSAIWPEVGNGIKE